MRVLLGLYLLNILLPSISAEPFQKADIDSISAPITSTDSCEKSSCGMAAGDTGGHGNALAVVLYDENSVLPMSKPERKFQFAGREIVVQQDWHGLGVAAVVWDAAEVLCAYLESHRGLVSGKSVMELGAGTGLVGIIATLLGGTVTITDREEVLQFLTTTVNSNLPDNYRTNANVLALDWTKDLHKFPDTYDVILGADIVYIEEVFEDLLNTLIQLSRKDTVILLSCRIRYDRDTNFLDKLGKHFNVEEILYDKRTDVRVYEATKL